MGIANYGSSRRCGAVLLGKAYLEVAGVYPISPYSNWNDKIIRGQCR